MEDRKRPATYDADDSAHPSKRQATAVNGGKPVHRDDGMPFKEDLEQYQKEAIWRQMQEYKRERNTLEAQLNEMAKRSTFHDDHLRIIDAWWKQLLDEVKLLVGDIMDGDVTSKSHSGDSGSFPSELLFADHDRFIGHLESRSKDIKSAIAQLFKNASNFAPPPDVRELQARISKLLASEKAHSTELDRVQAEKEQLEERLENASLRYMVAEKKLDRAKSQSVAKLERQAIFGGGNEAGGENSNKHDVSDPVNGVNGEVNADADAGRREALAVTVKQKEQLEKLEAENEKLSGEITTMKVKFSRLSEDDVARSDLFKHLKLQHEDVIHRINHLEATNVQLREEAEKLQAERTAYRTQIDVESQTAIGEMESQLARAETDLARVRTARDELAADVSIRKASQDQEQVALKQIKELACIRETRITVLESEVERLRMQISQANDYPNPSMDLDTLGFEELKRKYESLEKEYSMLNQELPSMGAAYKKAQALATKKVMDFSALEEKVARLLADKSKADQKYFSAMKAKDARENEIRALKLQNSKSSEIVAQLKDAERVHSSLVSNLEKQLTEAKAAQAALSAANRALQQRAKEDSISVEGLKSQVGELTTALKAKDGALSSAAKTCRHAEIELEKLRTRLEEARKSVDMWKGRSMGKETEEYEMLRALALCNVCRSRFKNTVIKSCGHVFCKECVEERISSRSRKCPTCGKSFPTNDHMAVHM